MDNLTKNERKALKCNQKMEHIKHGIYPLPDKSFITKIKAKTLKKLKSL